MAFLTDMSDKISNLQAQMSTIYLIQQDLQQVKSDIGDLRATLNIRLDNLSTRVDEIESRVSVVDCLNKDMEQLKTQVKSILEDGYKNEQWVRRSNIQINGVPQKA